MKQTMKQPLHEEFRRMQKLAGIINENENSKINKFSPEDNINFQWATQPQNPEEILTDEETGDTFSKSDFWKTDIEGRNADEVMPNYGNKQPDGTWVFLFDIGEISGFVEEKDFTLN